MIGQIDVLAPYLAGPGAAVIVLVLVLGGLYRLVVTHAVPLVAQLGARHLAQIDELVRVQRAEAAAIAKTLGSIDRRLARIEDLTDSRRIEPHP